MEDARCSTPGNRKTVRRIQTEAERPKQESVKGENHRHFHSYGTIKTGTSKAESTPMLRKELDMEFKELKDGDQSRIRNEINKQLKAGTAFTAKKSKAVNCKGNAPFKTTDKNGNKIAQGSLCTFWMNPKTGIARLYAVAVKAEKAPVTEETTMTMTKTQFEAAIAAAVAVVTGK